MIVAGVGRLQHRGLRGHGWAGVSPDGTTGRFLAGATLLRCEHTVAVYIRLYFDLGLYTRKNDATFYFIMSGRQVVEEPAPLPPTLDKNGEVIKQRTVEQQKKSDEALAKYRREQGQESNRSRSSSRRDRRKRIREQQRDGKFMHTNKLEALEEADANGELHAMQAFERIGPDSTSMDGPVTMARAMRGEIPMRGSNPDQPYYMMPPEKMGGGVSTQPMLIVVDTADIAAERFEGPGRIETDPRSQPGN
jgi:hypothetical protein